MINLNLILVFFLIGMVLGTAMFVTILALMARQSKSNKLKMETDCGVQETTTQ